MTIHIDGRIGEGGGQVLRTSLSLSAITGKAFVIEHIRGKRKKPGLKRQHLVSVEAAASICGADCKGDSLNSQRLVFNPSKIRAGNYSFDIGSAGSCCLVLQTVLPILFYADSSSTVTIQGGTHNPMAPTADFLAKSFLPAIYRFGFNASLNLMSYGFYPAGGGKIKAEIRPAGDLPKKVELIERGPLLKKRARILLSKLPQHIAEREKKILLKQGWFETDEVEIVNITNSPGPGNAVIIILEYENVTCVFQSIGEKGKRAEKVSAEAYNAAAYHHKSMVPVENFLTDQLLIYLALVSNGTFLTSKVSLHSHTNMKIIEKFLPVKFVVKEIASGQKLNCTGKIFRSVHS
ncbi:MAG TPA: RNA 3'-terminal phosphate cyclase [Deltaproteobacteria bacterium]|nr:RNA 3'-terminal phosphate cyclase [Deltaproteobacteria bacterium]